MKPPTLPPSYSKPTFQDRKTTPISHKNTRKDTSADQKQFKIKTKETKMPRSTSTNFTIKPPTNNTSSYPTKHTTPIKHQKSTMDLLSKNTKSHNRLPDINKATTKLPHNIAKRTLKDPGGSKTRKLNVGASKTIVPGSAKNVSRQVSSMGSAAKNPPSARDYKANLDSIVQSIDAGFVNNYLESAFDPLKDKAKPKLSKDEKIKRKKKVRIRYITSKIEEMKKKRTFLTS